MMDINPEVSTGVIDPLTGIPSQTTTEVTTRMIVPDGPPIFVGGLIKRRVDESKQGVPVIGRIPVLGRLFSNRQQVNTNSETIVLITPTIVTSASMSLEEGIEDRIRLLEEEQGSDIERLDDDMDHFFGPDSISFVPASEKSGLGHFAHISVKQSAANLANYFKKSRQA